MVNKSSPTFPNWRITFSFSCPAPSPREATSWKFFTEATVTRPLKLRHQHWSCSCHLGALFFKVRTSSFGLGKGPDEKLSTRVDFDLKKWREGKESTFTGTNSVCVGAKPPGSIEEAGIASMIHSILLGPLTPKKKTIYFNWQVKDRWTTTLSSISKKCSHYVFNL